MSSCRTVRALVAGLLATACSGGNQVQPITCAAPSECPTGSDCVLGACVAGELPTAIIAVKPPARGMVTHLPMVLDGSASRDPNAGHVLNAYAWTIRSLEASGCEPTPATGADPTLTTIFTCAGRYEVALTVKSDLGLESPRATLALAITGSLHPPAITGMGPDLEVGHRCAGSPLACTATSADGDALHLSVAAYDEEGQANLTYAWDVTPPPGVDRASVDVRFEPGPDVPSPTVRLGSAGTRLAGTWTFGVTVRDADGLTVMGRQLVTVGDRPPAIGLDRSAYAPDHGFSAAGGLYTAADTVTATITDPDGDPIEAAELQLEEREPSGCGFRVVSSRLSGGELSASFELTARVGEEAAFIGPERSLAVVARDVNGSQARAEAPLGVANRAPALVRDPGAPLPLGVPHAYLAGCAPWAAGCFEVAGDSPFAAVDPDGDPVVSALEVEDPSHLRMAVTGRHFTIDVDGANGGWLRDASGLSPFVLRASARDPWTAGASEAFQLAVQNRPPYPVLSQDVAVDHVYRDGAYRAEAPFATFVDDDGDPISKGGASSTSPFASFEITPAGQGIVRWEVGHDWRTGGVPDLSAFYRQQQLTLSASDAWGAGPEAGAGALVRDRIPALAQDPLSVEACVCGPPKPCGATYVIPAHARIPVGASDEDGDPTYVRFTSLSCGRPVDATPQLAFPRAELGISLDGCRAHTVDSLQWVELTGTVEVVDGGLWSSASRTIRVTCSRADGICGPGQGICP